MRNGDLIVLGTIRRRDLDKPHGAISDLTIPNVQAARNVLAIAVLDLHSWLPVSVRYDAAEAALEVVHRWVQEQELGDPATPSTETV